MTNSLGKFMPQASQVLAGVAIGLLLLAVSCGAAATATPRPADTPGRPVAQVATPTPAARPAATLAPIAAPVSTPIPTSAVSPGKVTWMIGSFGSERFDYTFNPGGGHDYARQIHGFLISSDVK